MTTATRPRPALHAPLTPTAPWRLLLSEFLRCPLAELELLPSALLLKLHACHHDPALFVRVLLAELGAESDMPLEALLARVAQLWPATSCCSFARRGQP
jgi:hypothetical protein